MQIASDSEAVLSVPSPTCTKPPQQKYGQRWGAVLLVLLSCASQPTAECQAGSASTVLLGHNRQGQDSNLWHVTLEEQTWGNRGGMKAQLRSANIFEGQKKKKKLSCVVAFSLFPCTFSCAFCLLELGQSLFSIFSDY